MSAGHIDLTIPILFDDRRYHIFVTSDEGMFVAYGEGFLNLQESDCAFGFTIEAAVMNFLEGIGNLREWHNLTPGEVRSWVVNAKQNQP